MQDYEFENFLKAFALVAEVYDKELNREQMSLYFELLRPFELDELTIALHEYMKSGEFFPRPASLIKIIRSQRLVKSIQFPELPATRERSVEACIKMDKALIELGKKQGRWDFVQKLEERLKNRIK
jgi:hypothetical protein